MDSESAAADVAAAVEGSNESAAGDATHHDTDSESEAASNAERKRKREALATAGLGYSRAKKRILHAFETRLWPILTEGGWAKVNGSDADGNADATYYVPPGVELPRKYARKKQYTERIKDVIDRVLERRNSLESRAADAYMDEVGDLVNKTRRQTAPRAASRRRGKTLENEVSNSGVGSGVGDGVGEEMDEDDHHVTLSWKFNDRCHFPKISSRVGEKYQVSHFPLAGSKSSSTEIDDAHCYYQVFDPQKAKAAGKIDFVHKTGNIPYHLKEAAMVALHRRDYITDGESFNDDMKAAKPMDGSDWSDEEKLACDEAIFEYRKDMGAVAKKLGKSICNAYTYYLNTYKQSDDYRLLKLVCQQERRDNDPDALADDDICQMCREGGHLLICDGCEMSYHKECLRPPLKVVPDGEWNCDYCLDEKILDGRDMLLKQSRMLQPSTISTDGSTAGNCEVKEGRSTGVSSHGIEIDGAKSNASTTRSTGKGGPTQIYTDEVMEATKRFAEAFRKALSTA